MLTQSLTRPLVSPLTRAVTEGGGGGFSVSSLFAAGEQGAIYDPSDLSTVFSDAAGTTPAVVDGVVGKILDKSGRGNHRTQSTTAQKPFLRSAGGLYWLEYDGVDDGMVTAAVDFSATDKMTVVAGIRKASDATTGMIVELGSNVNSSNGSFAMFAPDAAGNTNYGTALRGTAAVFKASQNGASPAPNVAVVSLLADIGAGAGGELNIRTQGVSGGYGVADAGTGNFGTYPLNMGRRNGSSLPFNGREFYTVIRGAASTATQVSATERIAAQKSGVTL